MTACLVLLLVISLIGTGLETYAQTKVPREAIPSDIPAEVRQQIERLYSSDAVERAYAAVFLGLMGARAAPAIPFLIGILDDSAPLEWVRAGALGSEPTSPGREAALALWQIEGSAAVERLVAALSHKDWRVRRNAAWALGRIKAPGAVEPLIAALNDKDRDVQEAAVEALGEIKDSRAVEPLVAALTHEKSVIRMRAAEALGKIKARHAVEPLIAALKDGRWSVRMIAAGALGEIKDSRAVEPLIAALKDEYSPVRRYAVEALEKITGKNFGQQPAKWQKWWEKNKENFRKGSLREAPPGSFLVPLRLSAAVHRIAICHAT